MCSGTLAGSARTVNRRYIADYIPKDQRTKASAGLLDHLTARVHSLPHVVA